MDRADYCGFLTLVLIIQTIDCTSLWGAWNPWSGCSRTCGAGVRHRTRQCYHRDLHLIRPVHHDRCTGHKDVYQVCSLKPCMAKFQDDREYQCYNKTNHRFQLGHKNTRWTSYVAEFRPCDLFCSPQGYNSFWSFGNASDGTVCWPRKSGVCINAMCVAVGCDGTTSSTKQLDKCLVCGGRNESCTYYSNQFRQVTRPDLIGYTKVTAIPAGSTNVLIEDININVIALEDSGAFLVLNAYRLNNFDTSPHLSKAGLQYYRTPENRGHIFLIGPTVEELEVMVLQRNRPIVINYEYWWSSQAASRRGHPMMNKTPAPGEVKPTSTVTVINNSDKSEKRKRKKPRDNTTNRRQKDGGFVKNSNNDDRKQGKSDRRNCPPKSGRRNSRRNGNRTHAKHQYCKSDFVIKVTVMTRTTNGALYRYIVIVRQIFRTRVQLTRQMFIWSDATSCDVPYMHESKDYIIMGTSRPDTSKRRGIFLLQKSDYAKKWTSRRENLAKALKTRLKC
ncbi:ADAMTS-like protein 5 [Tubulanus polymorphus]|uniref:ADAMTS-like protein 5 n=1 Tax=Tubulanus polymorphus TaxID=672921 RepID=UPI003DA37227